MHVCWEKRPLALNQGPSCFEAYGSILKCGSNGLKSLTLSQPPPSHLVPLVIRSLNEICIAVTFEEYFGTLTAARDYPTDFTPAFSSAKRSS